MRIPFALALFVLSIPQTQIAPQNRSGVEIVSVEFKFKMIKDKGFPPRMVSEQPPVIKPDLGRGTQDIHEPDILKIQRDANQRRSELRVLESKSHSGGNSSSSIPRIVPGYELRAEIKNAGAKSITRLVWAYHASLNPQDVPYKEFLCNVKIEPGETKAVKVTFPIPRQRVVSVADSGTPPPPQKPSLSDMVVTYVHLSDGTTWQRSDWNPIVLSRLGAKKLGKGKCIAL